MGIEQELPMPSPKGTDLLFANQPVPAEPGKENTVSANPAV